MPDEVVEDHGSSSAGDTFSLVRSIVLLSAGIGTLIYALVPPVQPELVTSAGMLIGLDPVLRATKK